MEKIEQITKQIMEQIKNINKIKESRLINGIKKPFIKAHNFMMGLSPIKFILFAVLLNMLIIAATEPLFRKYPIWKYPKHEYPVWEYYVPDITAWSVIRSTIIAPLRETFVFQTIPLFVFDDRRFGIKR